MATAIILVFFLGYLTIVFEHPLRLDKTVPALIMAAVAWALLAIGFNNGMLSVVDSHEHIYSLVGAHSAGAEGHHLAEEGFVNTLLHHLGKTAEILIFLIGAMTIVEIIDLHRGFEVLKSYVKTRSKRRLLWIVGILGFILSAIIDNLTATIVLVTLLRKIVPDKTERLWFVALIVIAANAGGAWSPIGDVTTTMLWIGNKVSAGGLIEYLVIPSIACFVVPFAIAAYFMKPFKGEINVEVDDNIQGQSLLSSRTMLFLGLGAIVFVPVFKTVTHLPPYLGMMLSLGVVWLVSEYIHPEEDFSESRREMYSAHKALSRIEMSSILFFLGILMAVAALESLVYATVMREGEAIQVGTLRYVAEVLDNVIPNQDLVIILLGFASAIIDNVPLVAASMGMYEMPMDSKLWHFIAYSAGTGGSMLIIGSAAGVAAMGMERIDFIWYLRKIAWLAFVGFIAGAAVFLLLTPLLSSFNS
ncbi:sodium:proton antiporter NhaD [Phaeodactylibacter luteus]|uniref:Sodium:proton antiporter n=1 Tax=Phaeodactylibacter luteus TaxID=1564516 RepID=A0A5C6RNH9_9BACT|nr:sodium:proton antiporter NhaD [Phaeodactylibacter luteus]TXB63465.1 sodium:proton antiporter [Phaeodactylibacter luteus]